MLHYVFFIHFLDAHFSFSFLNDANKEVRVNKQLLSFEMAFSVLRLCVLLLCIVSVSDAWIFGRRRRFSIRIVRCDSKRDCVSCTSHKSWSGQPCRWCPRDDECHAHGAVLANPCSRAENIVTASQCNAIVTPVYDSSLAYKMVYLSSLAYADNVATYIAKATEVGLPRVTMRR